MSNYLFLQFKRVLKLFPLFLLISAVFFAGLTAVYLAFMNMDSNSEENQKFKIGIVGNPGDEYMNMGMAAIQTMDSSRFALELVPLSEQESKQMLQAGEISAYAVFPENFIDDALSGEINSIRFVTTSSSNNLVSMFKDEITTVITDIMTQSQSASYGVYDALKDNGHNKIASKHLNNISIEYVDLILERSNLYHVQELGVGDGVQLPQYLFCSFTVLYVCVMVLPFAHLYIKKDNSLVTLLYSQGASSAKQVISEYTAFVAMILFAFLLIMGLLSGVTTLLSNEIQNLEFDIPLAQIAKYILPVILVTSSLGFMIYEFSGNLISGILTYFFTVVFLCYASGCIYPVYMLPQTLQSLSKILPFGVARSFLTGGIDYEFNFVQLLILMAYSILFIFAAVLLRRYKIIARSNK